jgi:DNA-binding FadR family transcriptional regulator
MATEPHHSADLSPVQAAQGGGLRAPRIAELVAGRLRQRIVDGDLADGDELPREAEMLVQFGVSRPSLREALRILETEGLIRIRRGKIGGAVVRRPTPETAAYHFGLALQSYAVTLEDLAAARAVLEPACAALAAAQPDRTEIVAELTRLVAESESHVGEDEAFTASALEFHAAMVTSALEAVWGSQERLWAREAAREGAYPDERLQRQVVAAHRKLIQRIERGDVDGAQQAMRKHLIQSQPFVNYGDAPIRVVESSD